MLGNSHVTEPDVSGLCNSFPEHRVCALLLLIFKIFYIGIRTALLESDDHTCPTCHQNDVSPDALIANKFLRQVAIFVSLKIFFINF